MHFIAQDYSYIQELSMHSVSTGQCELVCFSGGHFADPMMIMIKRMVYGHGLKLFPLLARRLHGLVVWYGHPVTNFGGISYSKWCLMASPTHSPPCYAGLKLVPTRKIVSKP